MLAAFSDAVQYFLQSKRAMAPADCRGGPRDGGRVAYNMPSIAATSKAIVADKAEHRCDIAEGDVTII